MVDYLEVMRHIPVLLIIATGGVAFVLWLVAWNFGAKGSTRWTAALFAVILFAFMCSGIFANLTAP